MDANQRDLIADARIQVQGICHFCSGLPEGGLSAINPLELQVMLEPVIDRLSQAEEKCRLMLVVTTLYGLYLCG